MYPSGRFLAGSSSFVQFLILILIILFTTLIVFFTGVLIAIPLFGVDVMDMLSQASGLENPEDISLMKYFQIVSQIGMFIIPPLIFSLLITKRPTKYLWLNRMPGLITIVSTFILIFTILPGINWMMGINEQLSLPDWLGGIENWMRESEESAARLTEAFLQTETISGLLLNLFMVALLASVGEELLFRGVLLRIFARGFRNVHIAVWLSAILFSMFHLQFYGFLPRLALGIIFGYMLVWSGSLWLPILAHFINNASAVLAYYFYNTGTSETPVESFGDVENNFLFALSLVISAILMVMIYFLNKDNRISYQSQLVEKLNG